MRSLSSSDSFSVILDLSQITLNGILLDSNHSVASYILATDVADSFLTGGSRRRRAVRAEFV